MPLLLGPRDLAAQGEKARLVKYKKYKEVQQSSFPGFFKPLKFPLAGFAASQKQLIRRTTFHDTDRSHMDPVSPRSETIDMLEEMEPEVTGHALWSQSAFPL